MSFDATNSATDNLVKGLKNLGEKPIKKKKAKSFDALSQRIEKSAQNSLNKKQ